MIEIGFYPLGKRRHIYLPQFGAESENCCKKEKDKGLWDFRGRNCIWFYEESDIELGPKEKGNLDKCWREKGGGEISGEAIFIERNHTGTHPCRRAAPQKRSLLPQK